MNKWIGLGLLCLCASAVGGAAGSLIARKAVRTERPHRAERPTRIDQGDHPAPRKRDREEHRRVGGQRPHEGWRSDFRSQALDVAARRIARRFDLLEAQEEEIHGLLDRATAQERELLDEYRQALQSDDREALQRWEERRRDIRATLEEALIPLVGEEGVGVLRHEHARLQSMRGWGHPSEGWNRPGDRDHRRTGRPGGHRPR